MKIAIFGSGGVGGYFGGRLAAAGEDVTFLARGAHLDRDAAGRPAHREPERRRCICRRCRRPIVPQAIGPVDVVLFTVKLYDVEASAATLAPLIGPDTVVITLQNGVDAMDMVAKHVGADHVAGGAAYIVAVIDKPGHMRHTTAQQLVFGERDGRRSDRLVAFEAGRHSRRLPGQGEHRRRRRSVDEVRASRDVERHDHGDAIADGRRSRYAGDVRDDDGGDRGSDRRRPRAGRQPAGRPDGHDARR